ncbi:DUF5677 domain-containing protein [Vibrio sp. SCSIO 43086]|uniref:DUF5677 domain-containing protein n=1 Tax=Vibrio sp. SCSIO 43086 TaxID=2822845 RepID=UPI003DA97913
MEEYINYLKESAERNKAHENEIPFIAEKFKELDYIGGELLREIFSSKLWVVKAIQSYVLVRSVNEILASLTFSVAHKKTASVETSFRIALEHIVNLVYILEDESIERSRSYLKHSIADMESKTQKGNRRAVREDDLFDKLGMRRRMDFVEQLKEKNPKLMSDTNLKWPNIFERFKAVGAEKTYRNMYATASDSIHTMSEDVINAIMVYNCPPEVNPQMVQVVESYKISFSVYLALFSLKYYCWMLGTLSNQIDSQLGKQISEIEEQLLEKIIGHELESLDETLEYFEPK